MSFFLIYYKQLKTKIGGVKYVIVFAWDVTYVTHIHYVSVCNKTFSHCYYIVVHSTCIFHDSESECGHFVAG